MVKLSFVAILLIGLSGCAERAYVHVGDKNALIPDACDPRGACNIGKRANWLIWA